MKYKISLFLLLTAVLFSCQDQDEKRRAENAKEAKKKEAIFNNINKGWTFIDEPINEISESQLNSWTEWRDFMKEIGDKPRRTIGAFQKKSVAISKKAMALNNTIPTIFDQPAFKSRISILITKIRMLDLFIHLNKIPDDKVVFLVQEINKELISLERQMDKIVERAKVPKEEGEEDFLRMLDTARAIPNAVAPPQIDQKVPKLE